MQRGEFISQRVSIKTGNAKPPGGKASCYKLRQSQGSIKKGILFTRVIISVSDWGLLMRIAGKGEKISVEEKTL